LLDIILFITDNLFFALDKCVLIINMSKLVASYMWL